MSTNGKTLNFRAAKIKGFTVFIKRALSNQCFPISHIVEKRKYLAFQ